MFVTLRGIPAEDIVATVDGTVITRAEYREYAAVFTRPDGSLDIRSDRVLVSLINQAIVEREARDRGIIVSEEDVDRRVSGAMGFSLGIAATSREGGVAAFRRRVRAFLQFEVVKAAVVKPTDVSPTQDRVTEKAWSEWLASARSCATIQVIDGTLGVPSSDPAPTCDER